MINVVAGIIIKDDKILCMRRKEDMHLSGYWEFAGGKVEQGESNEEALVRELNEELRIIVSVGAFVGQSTFDYDGKVVRLHAYLTKWIEGEIALVDHDDLCWLPIERLNTLKWARADLPLINQLKTFLYYENQAKAYSMETLQFDMQKEYFPFLDNLKKGCSILDLGCGSGRDALAFQRKGYFVTAVEPSPTMALIASENIKQKVEVRCCFNLNYDNNFDGIWACASLLHCPKTEFFSALKNLVLALKPDGYAYISLKEGEGEYLDDFNRFISLYQEDEVIKYFRMIKNITIVKSWNKITPLRNNSQGWINIILKKDSMDGPNGLE